MNNEILYNALNYYDYIRNLSNNYYLIMSNDIKIKFNERFILKYDNKEITMNYEVELIGTYIEDQCIWLWGWLTNSTKLSKLIC